MNSIAEYRRTRMESLLDGGRIRSINSQLPNPPTPKGLGFARSPWRVLEVGDWKLEFLRVQPRRRVGLRDVDFVEDFLLGEHALRGLRAPEHAVDDFFVGREPVLLEPEDHVRLARTADRLRSAARGQPSAPGRPSTPRPSARDHSSGTPSRPPPRGRRWPCGTRRGRTPGSCRESVRQSLRTPRAPVRRAWSDRVDPPHQHEVDEQHVHRRVADTLADAEDGAMHARRARLERGEAVDGRPCRGRGGRASRCRRLRPFRRRSAL